MSAALAGCGSRILSTAFQLGAARSPMGGRAGISVFSSLAKKTNPRVALIIEQHVSFSPQTGGAPRSHPSFQRQETVKLREIADPALVQQWDWWRERAPELTLCNAFNPIKFVPYGIRGWMTLRAAAIQGKLRPMMPLERCLLRLTAFVCRVHRDCHVGCPRWR
jgi:hypothetical protein